MAQEISEDMADRIKKIRCILFDVDGVLTDGTVLRFSDGTEARKFSVIDGHGISMLRERGIIVGVVSREDSAIIKDRMEKLSLDEIHIGAMDKSAIVNEIRERRGIPEGGLAFMGDDLPDLEAFEVSDLRISLSSGHQRVIEVADIVIEGSGGRGAVRDLCEIIIEQISN